MNKLKIFLKDWRNQKSYFFWLMKYSKPYLPKLAIIAAVREEASGL